jgi:excinuclease ABC subunit C
VGRDAFDLRVAVEDEDDEVLESLVQRIYANAPMLPPQIVVPSPIDEEGTIAAWLRTLRGGRVEIHCPKRGEKLAVVELARQNAEALLTDRVLRASGRGAELKASLLALQEALALPRYPMRIDCIDVSHSQGRDTVGACVAFVGGRPARALYRHFTIRGPSGNDDFASIHEVVARKLARARDRGDELPDLLVIDGGKGQLSSALDALREAGASDLPVVALAKEEEEIFVPGRRSALRLPPSPPLKLLQRVRDEAHRFVITFHRKRRARRTIATELTGIPGVGPQIASRVLERFGSVEGARNAGVEALARTPGVGPRLAARIAAALGVPPGEAAAGERGANAEAAADRAGERGAP